MTSIQLLAVQEHDPHNLIAAVEITEDDGTVRRMAHFMPKDSAEWRVAEYDLDPDDHDTLIDVLLFEGHVHASGDLAPEDTLHQAPTRAHARDALLGAVRARKAVSDDKRRAARQTAAKGKAKARDEDPEMPVRHQMKELFRIEPEVVEAKRAFVEMVRQAPPEEQLRLMGRDDRPAPSSAAERAAVFHQAIAMRSDRHAADTDQ